MPSSLPLFPFQILLDWYQTNGRHDLPWRDYNFDKKILGYRVWLAEIILQQTQASRGAIYFEKIIKRFPNIESLADTNYETFFEYYDGLGYYSRARNMLATAKQIVEKYDGTFPHDYGLLITLP
jgi:A/G-specific adenine glycosylase